MLYVPRRAPFDLFSPEPQRGLRLHVKRVFVMEEQGELLPQWLRFVRGVIDSEDLPLNVSREILQDSRITKTIRKQVIKQILDGLAALATDEPDDYAAFWKTFGAVLKEGLHFDPSEAERLSKLLRYESSVGEAGALVSLADAHARMKDGQSAVYYAVGESRRVLASSPHIEGLVRRGYEVLFMTDPIDEWALRTLETLESVKLQSATSADLELDDPAADDDDPADEAKATDEQLDALRARIAERLSRFVSEVRVSRRLEDSPACLVSRPGAMPPHLERLMRASQKDAPEPEKRVLELNPKHPLIRGLAARVGDEAKTDEVDSLIALLHEQARGAEGSPVEDPASFARHLAALMTKAVAESS